MGKGLYKSFQCRGEKKTQNFFFKAIIHVGNETI